MGEGRHGEAALKAGQLQVTAAEPKSARQGTTGCHAREGQTEAALFISSHPRRSLFTTIMALLSQPGLWVLARQCKGLSSEALMKPVSLGPRPAPHPPLKAWLAEKGRHMRATGQGPPCPGRPPGKRDRHARTLDFRVAWGRKSQCLASCWEPDTPIFTCLLPKALEIGSITSTLQKRKLKPREGMSLDEVTRHVGDTACQWQSWGPSSPCLPSLPSHKAVK